MAVIKIIWIFVYLAYCCSSNVSAGYVRDVYHDGFGIVNGDPVKITEVPFHAILWDKRINFTSCGGSIVHEQFVVTAAHCVRHIDNLADFMVKVGTDHAYQGDKYEIEKAIMHPNYKRANKWDYDVGIIKLKTKLKMGPTVQKIAMADSSLVPRKGDVFDTIGFGLTEKRQPSIILLKADVPYMERDECAKYEKPEKLTERMICAGINGKDFKGPCAGDSGGALRFKNHLLGIVSWTKRLFYAPGVFAFVPALRDFIDKTIEDNL